MNFRIQSYEEVSLWKQDAFQYIQKNESLNNLFWQIIRNREKSLEERWSGNVFCENKIKLSALHTPSNFLLISHGDLNAVDALSKYAIEQGWNLDGLSGPESQVKQFIKSSGLKIRSPINSSRRQFKIFQTNIDGEEFVNEEYHLSPVRAIDWPKARIWAQQFAIESEYSMDVTAIVQMAKQMNSAKNLFMLMDSQNYPCAMAGFGRSTDRFRVINMVYVPKGLRAQGMARELIIRLTKHARKQGYEQCLLFSEWMGKRNLYEAMGCRKIGTFMECDLG